MISNILNILGGLALFLYGLLILSTGFKKITGEKLKKILEKLTSSVWKGAGVGAITTSIIQSSSIMVVTLIGLLNAGFLSLRQAIGVMLGAEIGTTVTAQLISFKIGLYYLPFIIVGFGLFFFARPKRLQSLGQIILGFGLLFLGMRFMIQGIQPLKEAPLFYGILESFGQKPLLGILAGAVFTGVIQSSSATMSLVIALGLGGAISLPSAIALMLGANIGTCITGLLASIKSSLAAKRLAVAQLLFNFLGVALFFFLISPLSQVAQWTSSELARQIANAHTIFNILVVLIMLPLVGFLTSLVKKIIPGQSLETEKGAKFLDDRILKTPSLALAQSQKEVLRMARIAQAMLERSQLALENLDVPSLKFVQEQEPEVDVLHHLIDSYLTKIFSLDLSEKDSQKLSLLMHSVTDIERVGDHAYNLTEIAEIELKEKTKFSSSAEKELTLMFKKARASFNQAVKSLEENDKKMAQVALEIEKEVNRLDDQLQANHYNRFLEGLCQPEAGPLYLKIISNLERISDHAKNIAAGVIMGF
jgi:phosphate:Na+ symporter